MVTVMDARCCSRRQILALLPACLVVLPGGASAQSLPGQILDLVNTARARSNAPALVAEPRLARAAQGLADAMIRSGQMSHTADGRTLAQRAARVGFRYRRLGENIAWITSSTPDDLASRFVDMWLESPPHRANLMGASFSQTGIAVATAGPDIAAAQIFGAPQ